MISKVIRTSISILVGALFSLLMAQAEHLIPETNSVELQSKPDAIEVSSIDLENRRLGTGFDEYKFDDAIIYPPVRTSRLTESLDLLDPKSPQKEAHIHPFKYHVIENEHVYVAGDSRSQPFSKSGNAANSEARFVAELIAAHVQGRAGTSFGVAYKPCAFQALPLIQWNRCP